MACSATLNGLANTCENSLGGIKKVLFAPYQALADSAISGGVITTLEESPFKSYYTKKNVSNMVSTYNIDGANGTNYVSTELNVVFAKMTAEKRVEVNALATGDLRAVVIDANGNGWYLGADEALIMTAGTGETGTAKADGNKFSLTFTDESMQMPFPLSADLTKTFLGLEQ